MSSQEFFMTTWLTVMAIYSMIHSRFHSWIERFQEKTWFTDLHLTFFDPGSTTWPINDRKTYNLTRQWMNENCKNNLPRGYFFKMQIEQKFSYHDSSYSHPLEVTIGDPTVRSDSLVSRSISLNYPNCGYYMVKVLSMVILWWKII